MNITKPSVNMSHWYTNAKPGPSTPTCTTGSFPGMFDNNGTLDRSNSTQFLFPNVAYDCQVRDGSGNLLGRIAYTPGNPAAFVVEGVIFFDGKLDIAGNNTVVYSGRGTIYASDLIRMRNNLDLCPTVGCNAAAWDPDTTILGFVAIYTVLFLIEMKLMLKAIRKGPQEHPMPPPSAYRAEAGQLPRGSLAAGD